MKIMDVLTENLHGIIKLAAVNWWSLKPHVLFFKFLKFPNDGRQAINKDFHSWLCSFCQHMKRKKHVLSVEISEFIRQQHGYGDQKNHL